MLCDRLTLSPTVAKFVGPVLADVSGKGRSAGRRRRVVDCSSCTARTHGAGYSRGGRIEAAMGAAAADASEEVTAAPMKSSPDAAASWSWDLYTTPTTA